MATVIEIYHFLDKRAPFSLQMSYDNAGFLVGREEAPVERLMVSLDITEEVIEESKRAGCQLIVSHHPIIFRPAKAITDSDPTGRCLLALTENHIAAICAHTNLDAVEGGVNDALAKMLGLNDIGYLHQDGVDPEGRPYGIGRVGEVSGYPDAHAFAAFVQERLHAGGLRLEDAGRPVRKVAVGGGACGDMLVQVAAQGCDTFVTADVKYNTFLDARAMGINLIDAGHFSTEDVVCPVLADWLKLGVPDIEVIRSRRHKEVFSCL